MVCDRTCRPKWKRKLCQNCVTYPPKPPVNIVIYGRIEKYLVVADEEIRFACVALQKGTRLVERQARESREQRTGLAVPKVAKKIRFDVPLRKEFLVAAETRFPSGEKLLVHLSVIKAGHRPAIEAKRPRGEDQVCAL